jgi:selenocysteine lyase/cysteine desulfurase
MESGTRNIPGIAALGAGVHYILEQGIDNIRNHEMELVEFLLDGLTAIPEIKVLGSKELPKRVGIVSCVFPPHKSPDEVAGLLDRKYEIITRSGLHCAPLAHKTAGSYKTGALRLSMGLFNKKRDVEEVLTALKEIIRGE